MSIPTFDHLHVVSDLHLGGVGGDGGDKEFQIFNQKEALSWFVRDIAEDSPDKRVGILLNGDVVDFLAEEPFKYLDPKGAVKKLERILLDTSFADVWDAFRHFIQKENRFLIIQLGNHDVELALPQVQNFLRERLCKNNRDTRGRLIFSTNGNGYLCKVGGADVLCLHGNEKDTWNPVDFNNLSDIIKAMNRLQKIPDWTPNAGTKMVIDVMNEIKKKYKWIDLLKPETKAVPALLLALDNNILGELRKIFGVLATFTKEYVRKKTDFLSAEEADKTEMAEKLKFEKMLFDSYDTNQAEAKDNIALENLLKQIDTDIHNGIDPLDLKGNSSDEEFLGIFGALWDKIFKRSPEKNIRDALQKWLAEDRTFDLTHRDDSFSEIDKLVGEDLHFVIAGHTHLQRAIKRNKGFYYNSGTWIRLMQITKEMLDDEGQFAKLWKVFEKGTMEAIDNPAIVGLKNFKVVKQVNTVVSINDQKDKVQGCLQTVEKNGNGSFKLKTVPQSIFTCTV